MEKFTIRRRPIVDGVIPLFKLFSLKALPFAPTDVSLELRGVPTSVSNALRRTLTDEMAGHCLRVPSDGYDTELSNDPFAIAPFVCPRIAQLPLVARLPPKAMAELRFMLDVTNNTPTSMYIYSGNLTLEGTPPKGYSPLIFNPTVALCFLQPGCRIVIRGIRIETGRGVDHADFNVACRAAHTHLDLQQFSDSDMRLIGGKAVDSSGYKISSMLANPRHHRLTFVLPAVPSDTGIVYDVVTDACLHLRERLLAVVQAIDRRSSESGGQLSVVQLADGLQEATLTMPGETHTIGNCMIRAISEIAPDVSFAEYTVDDAPLKIVVRHPSDAVKLLKDAAKHLLAVFESIRAQVAAFKPAHGSKGRA